MSDQPPAPNDVARPRTGFIAIVGRPNVGKSTLLNALVGERVSITSARPQTTRQRVVGVLTRAIGPSSAQFIFVDTPGFQERHRSLLGRRMNEAITQALGAVDAIVLVIDAKGWTRADERLLALIPATRCNVVLVLNKVDLVPDRDSLLPLLAESSRRREFAALVPVSAEKKWQLDELLRAIEPLLPEGEPLFAADQFTDRSARYLAAEFIREKAFRLLGDELPYGVAVAIDQWTEDDRHAEIAATLLVERESHKAIAIGAGGGKLREIGRLARKDIENMLGKPVDLRTWVRVRRGWTQDAQTLKSLGYE